MEKIALIPAYEPDSVLIRILQELNDAGFTPVVVNDGSPDSFNELFSKACEYGDVISHSSNLGKGTALKNGLSYIQSHFREESVIVTLDADGQHAVSDAARLAQEAEKNRGKLILGSRKFEKSGVKIPLRSRFGNSVTRCVFFLRTGQHIYDTQTGLRAFSSDLIPVMLGIDGERYEYEINVLLYFADHEMEIREIPIRVIYFGKNESSHFDAVRDSIRIYRKILKKRKGIPQVLKFALSSFAGFLTDYSLYSILVTWFGFYFLSSAAVTAANILARIVSASVNYTINRHLVFHSEENAVKSAVSYAILASCILAGNTFLLNIFVDNIKMNRYLAKLLTEITFFIMSWLVQKCLIFRKKKAAV